VKTTFRTWWGWSTLSDWGGGVRLPDAVRLPDGEIIDLSYEEYQTRGYRYFTIEHPHSKAKYVPMNDDSTVRLSCDSGGSDGSARSGERWMLMKVIAPKASIFLYGGTCAECEGEMEYSDDPDSSDMCPGCLAYYEELERLVEEQRRYIEEQERLADEEWKREYGHLLG